MNPFIVIIPLLFFIVFLGCNQIVMNDGSSDPNTENGETQSNRFISIAIIFALWVLTAFRSINIGNDTHTYINVFRRIANYGVMDSLYMEKGYQYFNLFISRIFGNDGQALLIICASICYISIAIFILKESKNCLISTCLIFIFVFSCYTNTIRQGIAMSICIPAYIFLQKDKKIISCVFILIAMQFHYTAVILFFLFLYKFTPNKFKTVFLLSAVLVLLSLSGVMNRLLLLVIPRGTAYFSSERVGTGYLALTYELIRDLIFCYFSYIAYEDNRSDEDRKRMMIFIICVLTTSLSFGMNLIARANGYLLILQVVELPSVFINMKNKNKRIYAFLSCAIMLTYFIVVQILRPEWNHLIPYEFWKKN